MALPRTGEVNKRGTPVSTYRLQFNRQFGFKDAQSVVAYLYQLGISDLYASPILKSRPGSSHGYDIVDPSRFNLELGSELDFDALHRELKSHAMGLLLDIVPNHMAAHSDNPWWMDVLANGPNSPFASFFDIDWHPTNSALDNKVLLPILGRPYSDVLENRELALRLEGDDIYVHYYDTRLPINLNGCSLVVAYNIDALAADIGTQHPDFLCLTELVRAIAGLAQGAAQVEIRTQREALLQIIHTSPKVKNHVCQNINIFNGTKGSPGSFSRLHDLLSRQFYQLAFWRSCRDQLNYRCFFDISDLVAVRVEAPPVFAALHDLIIDLVKAGKVNGLRLDHIDGLYNPFAYLERLRSQVADRSGGNGCYVVAEKILAAHETVREDWPLAGTTGYDFLNALNTLFVDATGIEALRDAYARFTGSSTSFHHLVIEKKRQVIVELFASDLQSLSHRLAGLAAHDRYGCDISRIELKHALIEITACLPIYRTYVRRMQVAIADKMIVEGAVEAARRNPKIDQRALRFIRRVLLLEVADDMAAGRQAVWLDFVMRWQQFTGPVMAKGGEDTALYNYSCLVSRNEVGGEPDDDKFGIENFHNYNRSRLAGCPHSMSGTSTHDTKRSEDVRARINVLSEIPTEWERRILRWWRWNQTKKIAIKGVSLPDANMEMLIYQTMIGAWPLRDDEIPTFNERLEAYAVKAAREAKTFTNWLSPSKENESALVSFVHAITEPSLQNRFLEDFRPFQKRVAFYGAINALSQVVLKATAPGIPDFYQGTELWDFSLVDPDNRRPVDFVKRSELLDAVIEREKSGISSLLNGLLDCWDDGHIKLYLTRKALSVRNRCREVFADGAYIPLLATGASGEHVCAFIRHHEDVWTLTAAPRLITRLCIAGHFPLGKQAWGDDVLNVPDGAPSAWLNVLTNERITVSSTVGGLRLAEVFFRFPVALFVACH